MDIENNLIEYRKALMEFNKRGLLYKGTNEKNWGFVPCPDGLIQELYNIYEEGFTLIDLGCGAGNILDFAKNIGYEVLGIDWDREILKEIEKKHSFVHKDINELDPSFWADKNVVYTYIPIKSKAEMRKLLHKVANNMSIGSYLYTPEYEFNKAGFERISRFVIKKVK